MFSLIELYTKKNIFPGAQHNVLFENFPTSIIIFPGTQHNVLFENFPTSIINKGENHSIVKLLYFVCLLYVYFFTAQPRSTFGMQSQLSTNFPRATSAAASS